MAQKYLDDIPSDAEAAIKNPNTMAFPWRVGQEI